MNLFEAPIFTDAGRVLLNRAIAGENLIFSSIKMGKGDIGSVEIASMTDLIDPVAVLDIYKIKAEKETATITASFSNKDLEQGFLFKELGLFAKDPDGGQDILYCYQNAFDTAEYISASGSEIIEKQISIISIVGSAQNVSAKIDGSLVYVTWKEFEKYVESCTQVFIQDTEPDSNNCFWIRPKVSPVPSPEEAVLELSNRLDSAHYYAEIDGALNAIENAVDTDGELTEGNYRFKIT